jgi:hypothetical protein
MVDHLRKPGTTFKLVTATVACDDIAAGVRVLRAAFAELKRRVAWKRSVAGDESHLQVKAPHTGSVRSYCVHVHAIIELKPGTSFDRWTMHALWVELLSRRGAARNFDIRGIGRHWALYRGEHHASHSQSGRVLRVAQKTCGGPRRAPGVHPRRAAAVPTGGPARHNVRLVAAFSSTRRRYSL